jgi:hypothetical protein
MAWKDKLEIGLKEDATFQKDNLPQSQVRGRELESGRARPRGIPAARRDRNIVADSYGIDTIKEPVQRNGVVT